LRQGGKEQTLAIEESVPVPPAAALRFAGFHSPEAAKTLGGAELLVSREDAAPLEPGEFYVEDLKGLVVLFADDRRIMGHISDIIEGGGGDLVEIRLQNGEKRLVPFRKEFVTGIDLVQKQALLQNLWILE
jgi:16S rRNA processing protein RimM